MRFVEAGRASTNTSRSRASNGCSIRPTTSRRSSAPAFRSSSPAARFYPSQGELARLVPRPSITSTVRACVASFTPTTVGVHVRRTDNVEAIARSPTHAFLTLMHERVRDDPATRFFVATDSRDEEQAMRQVFWRPRDGAAQGAQSLAPGRDPRRSRRLAVLAQTSLVTAAIGAPFRSRGGTWGRPLIVVDVTRGTSSTV